MALIVRRGELVNVLIDALSIDESSAAAVIDFFSFRAKVAGETGHRGLWAAPLVPVPGKDAFGLALPVLVASAPLRKVEAWLEKGGLNDNLPKGSRGERWEDQLRQDIREAIDENPLLRNTRCAAHAVKRADDDGEEIDLLIQLDTILIVGEIKFWLVPADPFERFNYFRKLKSASEQARRKASFVHANPDVAAKALRITETEVRSLKIVPLVVANQGFGFALDIDGCRITDSGFLLNYLGAASLVTGMAIDPASGRQVQNTTELYRSEREAAKQFETAFAKPSVLGRFIDRIQWIDIPFPTSDPRPFYFKGVQLNDLSGDERATANAMRAILNPTGT